MRLLARGFVVVLLLSLLLTPAGAQEDHELVLPAKLMARGKTFLYNDLQAAKNALIVFRSFRREFRRLEGFEEVGKREDAELVAILSGDPDVAAAHGIINRGIRYPSGYVSNKVMILVIVDAKTNEMLWFDAVDWDTTGNITRVDSHERLVRRLKEALDKAG